MAYVNGQWLDRPEREERIALLRSKLKKLRNLIDLGKATEFHYDMFRQDGDELKKLLRVNRSETDHLYFFYEYFSEARNPGNPDNLVPTPDVDMDDAPEFHGKLSSILDSVSNYNKTANVCWSASRGHAKSAYLSNSFPTREIVFRKRQMIMIISETLPGSMKFIKWVSSQLKYNEKLREDFGELLSPDAMKNVKDSQDTFVTTTGTMMACSSLGKQIRGIRNGSVRPDLILLDDLESKESNNTEELRQKNRAWFNMEMYPARDVTRCATIFMGTMTHPQSLLSYVLNERHDFIKNMFPAILEEPKRGDLWAEFIRIYNEYEPTPEEIHEMENAKTTMLPPKERAAMDFYNAHKKEMDEGVKVLWQSRFPYHKLLLEKANIGSHAFSTEFLNIPYNKEDMMFDPDRFYYYEEGAIAFNHQEFDISLGLDFSMGKERGDYSAAIVIAKHKVTKKIYVVESVVKRVHPDEFIKLIVEVVRQWQPDIIAAEAQMLQEFLVDTLKKELQKIGYPSFLRVKKIQQRNRKEMRIEALMPDIENGTIVFNRRHTELLTQFEQYGLGYGAKSSTFDDAPDALEMAISGLKHVRAKVMHKQKWM